jgi:hypothetical protein
MIHPTSSAKSTGPYWHWTSSPQSWMRHGRKVLPLVALMINPSLRWEDQRRWRACCAVHCAAAWNPPFSGCAPLRYFTIRHQRAFGFRVLWLHHFLSSNLPAGIAGHRAGRDGAQIRTQLCRVSANLRPSRRAISTARTALSGPDDPYIF